MKKIYIQLLTLVFALGFIGCLVWLNNNRKLRATGIQVEGIVMEYHQEGNSDQQTTFYPIVEFALEDGRLETVRLRNGSNPPEYAVGDPVSLIYAKGNSADATINSTFWLYLFPTIFAGICVICVLIGLGTLGSAVATP